jgi:hypothetical protein
MRHRQAILRNINVDQDTLLLSRRQRTYKIISSQVRNQQSATSESVMYGLAFSALLEHRIGDHRAAKKHLQACLAIRQMRLQQSMTVISYPMGTLCIPVCLQVGAPQYFKSLKEIARASRSLRSFFRSLQHWKHIYGGSFSDCAQTKSTLRLYLAGSIGDNTTTGSRLCLGLLFTLVLASWRFQHHDKSSSEFLQSIAQAVDENTHGARQITPLGMLYTTHMCIDRFQSTTTRRTCIIDVWQTVDLVELLMFTAHENITSMKHQLLAWLLDDVDGPVEDLFNEGTWGGIENIWSSTQQSPFDTAGLQGSFATTDPYSPSPKTSLPSYPEYI